MKIRVRKGKHMKSKFLRMMFVTVLATSLIAGCGKREDDTKNENIVYGQVTAISDGEITIDVAEMGKGVQKNDISATNDESNDTSNESTSNNEIDKDSHNKEEQKSNLTGESKTISFAKKITFSKEQMGGGRPDMNGDGRQPGEVATDSNGQTVEVATDSEGNYVTKNVGDDSNQPPEKPSGDENNQPPEMPSGDDSNQPPEMPSGDDKQSDSEKKNFERETESINLSDITVGDMVKITLDDSGKATNISVVSMVKEENKQNESTDEQQETTTEISNALNDAKRKESTNLVA